MNHVVSGSDHKRNDRFTKTTQSSASFHHPALYSLLAPLTAAEPQQKLRMAVWDKKLLWSFMFLLAGKTEVLF